MVKKGKNFKRKTKSLLIATQNNSLRTGYINVKIDKCRLCGNKDETINLQISEFIKQAKKLYKTRNMKVRKAIH